MDDNVFKVAPEPEPRRPFYQKNQILLKAGALALAFLIGFVPMWLKTIRLSRDRQEARNESQMGNLESLAAAAVIDARRGQYEPACQNASRFFTALREEIDRGRTSS